MSTRLYVRLARDSNVPGQRCAWVLRDARGAELRRGEDVFGALPRADAIVGILAQDLVLIRCVSLPPGRRARSAAALANAMEPFLLSEPAANHVVILGQARDGSTVLAAVARAWLDPCLGALREANRAPSRLVVESSLVARAPGLWTAVCRGDGGFLCTEEVQAIALDAAADGDVPAGLKVQVQAARAGGAEVHSLRVYHDPGLALNADRWREELGLRVEDALGWDWAKATGAQSGFDLAGAPDLMAELKREHGATEPVLRLWRAPILLALLVLAVHVGATAVQWGLRSSERAALRGEIDLAFRKSVAPSEPLVDAVLQTRRALAAAKRGAGQYAPDDFMVLLGRLSAESGGMPANALRSLAYTGGALTAEWRGIPPANLERLADQLRAQGLRVEVASTAAQSRLTLRVGP